MPKTTRLLRALLPWSSGHGSSLLSQRAWLQLAAEEFSCSDGDHLEKRSQNSFIGKSAESGPVNELVAVPNFF